LPAVIKTKNAGRGNDRADPLCGESTYLLKATCVDVQSSDASIIHVSNENKGGTNAVTKRDDQKDAV
jgi:hypothetical protein